MRAKALEGTVVFVDISGFTKMSERLARHGRVGAEEVTDVVGFVFRRLLATAYANGGGLIKFGGDALLLWFAGEEHASDGVAAAIGMRQTLKEMGPIDTTAGKVRLRMSVGVHSGTFNFFLVGDRHRELLLTGPAATRVVTMEGTADAGEVVVSPETAALIPRELLSTAKGEGTLLRRNLRLAVDDAGAFEPKPQSVPEAVDLAVGIPRALREVVESGQSDPEHRRVTIGFIHYDGMDEMVENMPLEEVAAAIDGLVSAAEAACESQGVTFLGTDVDKDGGKIILVAGAPTAAGDDEARMLAALRQVQATDLQIPIRAGVNTGPVFAGDVGPSYRRTYTVMGDAVNLAARVMAKAESGQILAAQAVLDASSVLFETEELEPFLVKGKTLPVYASVIGQPRGAKEIEDHRELPLIGRDFETAILQRAVRSALAGDGSLIEVVGPPGVGKTRLHAELRAISSEMRQIAASCDLYSSSTPYGVARSVMLGALGLDSTADRDTIVSRLMQAIWNSAPNLTTWVPLLGVPLDLELPTNPEVDQLGQEFRRTKLNEAVSELFVGLLREPTLIALEDTHWMDDSSSDLFRHLAREVASRPWLISLTRRDEPTGFHAPTSAATVSLRPDWLSEDQVVELLVAATDDAPLRPHEMSILAQRSGGNPLFLQELLRATRRAGTTEGLPDTVEAMVTAQIDRMSQYDRRVLRHASVLGMRFRPALVEELLEDPSPIHESVWRRLGEFLERDGEDFFRFRHALMRDAAYEGLAYKRRRQLHERAGEAIERRRSGPEENLDILALHFFHAQAFEKSWEYSRAAARSAEAAFTIVEATEHLERALRAARRMETLDGASLAEVFEALGDLRERMGQYPEAADAYTAARRILSDDDVALARLCFKHSMLEERNGSLPQALRWLTRGLNPLTERTDLPASRERARLTSSYGTVRMTQGRRPEAVEWLKKAIAEAEASGEREALAHALFILDLTLIDMGRPDEGAVYSDRAMELYVELGKLGPQASIFNNRGHRQWIQGNWDKAVEYYDKARQLRLRLGDAVDAATGTHNIAEVLSDQGRLDEAREMFEESLRVWRAADFGVGVAYATSSLGRVASRSGDFERAAELYEAARDQFQGMGADAELIDTDARIAEALVFRHKPEEAIELTTDALRRATAHDAAQQPMILRIRGYAHAQQGEWDEADADFAQSVEIARARQARYELALTLDAIAHVAESRGHSAKAERAEANEIFRSLDTVTVPRVPLGPSAVAV